MGNGPDAQPLLAQAGDGHAVFGLKLYVLHGMSIC